MSSAERDTTAEILGRYVPFAKLAQGGMADVFLARSVGTAGLSRVVVLKQLRTDVATDGDADLRRMFFEEARLTMQLNHPNIVHVYDVDDATDALYIVMEFAEGHTLLELRRALNKQNRVLPAGLVARVACEVLAGLHYAHELKAIDGRPLQIVHRDVSPGNVIVGYDGRVQLIDFGIAKANMHGEHTEVGLLKGKLRYMSPEQLTSPKSGVVVDRRSDLFSLAVVMWELLTGVRMAAGVSDLSSAIALANLEDPLPRPSTVKKVDAGLDDIIAKALSKRPSERYKTALEMKDALENWLNAVMPVPRRMEDLGAIVAGCFSEERAAIQARIRRELADPPPSSVRPRSLSRTDLDALASIDTSHEPRDHSGSGSARASHAPPGPSESAAHRASQKESRRRLLWILLALLFVGGALVAMFISSRDTPIGIVHATASNAAAGATDSTSAPTEATNPVAVAANPSAPTTTAAPVPPNVATATPPSAPQLTLRGRGAVAQPRTRADRSDRADRERAERPAPTPPTPRPPPVDTKPAEADSIRAADNKPSGFLTIDTYPWTRVSLNGRVLGDTPLVKVSLPAGTHTLVFENADENIKQTTTVTIKPGETVSRRLAF